MPFVLLGGVCVVCVVWQAKKAVAEKKAAEEAEKVRSSPHLMDAVSVALRATRAHSLSGDIRFIHTRVRCVGPPRRDCACAFVRRGDGGDRVCVRIAVVAGSIDSTALGNVVRRSVCSRHPHVHA
jgi:hypothetical protein